MKTFDEGYTSLFKDVLMDLYQDFPDMVGNKELVEQAQLRFSHNYRLSASPEENYKTLHNLTSSLFNAEQGR